MASMCALQHHIQKWKATCKRLRAPLPLPSGSGGVQTPTGAPYVAAYLATPASNLKKGTFEEPPVTVMEAISEDGSTAVLPAGVPVLPVKVESAAQKKWAFDPPCACVCVCGVLHVCVCVCSPALRWKLPCRNNWKSFGLRRITLRGRTVLHCIRSCKA
jgi:hypothetical protein